MWIIRRLCDWMRRTHERIIRIPLFTTLFIVNNLSHTPNREGEKETQSTSLWSHFQSRIPLVLVSQAAIYQFVLIYGFIPKKKKENGQSLLQFWPILVQELLLLLQCSFPHPLTRLSVLKICFFVCMYICELNGNCMF